MPKRQDIHSILVIGSGPIVISSGAEFDYSGCQACLSLKEEGYEVILVNSNPATIMTDTKIADKVYMEPMDLEYVAKIIRKERPDAILPTLGGQTGLNLSVQLSKHRVIDECGIKVLGTSLDAIQNAEDRELFKNLCQSINEPVLESYLATTIEKALESARKIGYPVILRPGWTLGGSGGGFANNDTELVEVASNALRVSPASQVLVEKSIKGMKEIEFEVMRDANDTTIAVCSMENIDPVGVHTGDSMVVCPTQTLTNKEFQMLRDASLRVVRELKIEGGCNVQLALDPYSFDYYLIEVNPRVSRSSALASKATGYPIASVSAKIAVGMRLDEIKLCNTWASFEPAIDYVVTKIARFPFDKFSGVSNVLSTQMKATGEIMAIGRTMEESLMKAVRSLELGSTHKNLHLCMSKFTDLSAEELLAYVSTPTDDRLFAIAELLRQGTDLSMIYEATKIDMFFLDKIDNIVHFEKQIRKKPWDLVTLRKAKRMGISDMYIASQWNSSELELYRFREKHDLFPVYKMIDTCAGEFSAYIPYFYSTYETENESIVNNDKPSIIVLGSSSIRIGQGVEFDYSTVHAIWAIQKAGYEAIVINNNPETVSTDYSISDKLYFEPLCIEDVMNIYHLENPIGVIVTLGGQTSINLAQRLHTLGIPIIGTSVDAIDKAENRERFDQLLNEHNIPKPVGKTVYTVQDGLKVANSIEYPVLVRPSYVLGGRSMQIVYTDKELENYLVTAVALHTNKRPVLIDKYIDGKELEVDAVCDGESVLIPGIMEHIEKTGVHSGDSMSVYPPYTIGEEVKQTIYEYTRKLGLGIGIIGLMNVQFIYSNEKVYIIEVNPRSSRTVPFISKVTGIPLPEIAIQVMLGKTLQSMNITLIPVENENEKKKKKKRFYVKAPVFSFSKLSGANAVLSPEMKSTGEAIGYDDNLKRALYKALKASGMRVQNYGTIFASISRRQKRDALPILKRFYDLGFNIESTTGTAEMLSEIGVKTRVHKKISEGSQTILNSLRRGFITYVINNVSMSDQDAAEDCQLIRKIAVENNVTMLTSLDTARVLLDVLEDITVGVSCIDQ